jgi:hypothetical protein
MADDSKLSDFTFYNACFDWYYPLFTDKQTQLFDAYFHFDLSLQEIAQQHGISKAAVSDALKQIKEKLTSLESHFQLVTRIKDMETLLQDLPTATQVSLRALWQPRDRQRK